MPCARRYTDNRAAQRQAPATLKKSPMTDVLRVQRRVPHTLIASQGLTLDNCCPPLAQILLLTTDGGYLTCVLCVRVTETSYSHNKYKHPRAQYQGGSEELVQS